MEVGRVGPKTKVPSLRPDRRSEIENGCWKHGPHEWLSNGVSETDSKSNLFCTDWRSEIGEWRLEGSAPRANEGGR